MVADLNRSLRPRGVEPRWGQILCWSLYCWTCLLAGCGWRPYWRSDELVACFGLTTSLPSWIGIGYVTKTDRSRCSDRKGNAGLEGLSWASRSVPRWSTLWSGTSLAIRVWRHELVDGSRKNLLLPPNRTFIKSNPPGWILRGAWGRHDRGLGEDPSCRPALPCNEGVEVGCSESAWSESTPLLSQIGSGFLPKSWSQSRRCELSKWSCQWWTWGLQPRSRKLERWPSCSSGELYAHPLPGAPLSTKAGRQSTLGYTHGSSLSVDGAQATNSIVTQDTDKVFIRVRPSCGRNTYVPRLIVLDCVELIWVVLGGPLPLII